MEQARTRPDIEYSLMYFDLDQLHVINDTFGREAGDRILRGFGDILRNQLDGHTVARVTSDSFAALISDCALSDGEQFGKLICKQLHSLEFNNGSKAHRPTVSIGIASLDPSNPEANDALAHAQVACQAAKDRGRDRVEIYHTADASIIRRMDDISLIGALRNAVEQGQLVLYAQPIIPVKGRCADKHYELLVRLLDENGTPIEPSKFLGTAERYQLIQDIDRWVVSKALEALSKRPALQDGSKLFFAINLSGQSLGNEQFLEFLLEELSVYRVDPRRLCFEITETVAVSNQAKAQKLIQELKAIGCQFSLDDFGTGLSSFAYLKLFNVDKIKIDGSFVHDIGENEVSRAMVSAIAEIGRVMGVETVAEYVSDAASVNILRDMGVDWAQGFHVGEPFRLSKLISEAAPVADREDDEEYIDTVVLQALPS
jgi:diguanylate cyclase (GGDEF)-like protein